MSTDIKNDVNLRIYYSFYTPFEVKYTLYEAARINFPTFKKVISKQNADICLIFLVTKNSIPRPYLTTSIQLRICRRKSNDEKLLFRDIMYLLRSSKQLRVSFAFFI